MIESVTGYYFKRMRANTAKQINHAISLLPKSTPVTFIDIGAAGEIEPRWKAIETRLNYVGFEPDPRSYHPLVKKSDCAKHTIFPNALWDHNSQIELNLCKKPEVSSVFRPNHEFLKLFPSHDRFDVLKNLTISAVTLDELQVDRPDFIKLDIQGGELNVLKGGARHYK